MKKVLIGLGALVVLAIAAVLVGPSFIDWNSYKPEIAQRVKEATGRNLAIDGDISLSILPSPTLAVEQVRFANIEGGSAPDMATLDSLDVRIALMPLVRGEIQVESVALVRPTILLETLADGRANWQLVGADGAAAPSGATAGGDGGLDIRLDSVEIDDGTLIYRDSAAGTEERIEALDATITAASLQGPFEVDGIARVHGLPLGFEASSGVLAQGRTVPVGLRLTIQETEAEARFSGTLRTAAPAADGSGEGLQVSGKIEAGGPSLARLIVALSPGASMPASLADSFALESSVEYAAPLADFPDVRLRLGETMATGSLNVDTGAPLFAKARLKLNRLDIDKLLSTAATPPAAAPEGAGTAPAPAASATAPTSGFTLPRNIGGEFELAIDAIGYSGGVITDAQLSAALADGSIIITRASALLPGGSDLAVAGTIDADGGQPRFAGAVEASSDNFRGMLDWLRLPLPAQVASDRLRKLSLTTRVSATPTTVQIADVDLRIDSSRVTGGIAVALPEAGRRAKPGFGIGLAIDKLNLDGYLGDQIAASEAAGAAAPADGADGPATTVPDAEGAGGLPLGALKPLAAFDANVELRIGSLTYHEQTMQGLHVDGTLQAGNLTLRDLSVKEFAGGKGALSGSFTDLAGRPRFDTRFDLSAGDAGRVLQFAGVDFPGRSKLGRLKLGGTLAGGQHDVAYDAAFSFGGIGAEGQAKGRASGLGAGIPLIDTDLSLSARDAGPLLELVGLTGASEAKLGALSVTGTAASGTDDLTYDVSFSLSGVGGTGALAGTITEISTATPQVDTKLDLSVEKPAGLLRLAGVDGATAGRLGKLGVEGTMGGGADAMQLDLGLAGLGGTARVNGTVSAMTPQADAEAGAPTGTTFDLALDLNHPELRQLLAAVAADYKPTGETLGAFHLATKASGSVTSATLTDLVMEAGDSRVTGTMSYEAAGARPMVILALIGNTLDLRGMLPADTKGSGGGSGGGGSGGGASPWSREPLDLAVLDAADADIDVVADAVILDDMRIDDLKAKFSLRDGILDVTQLAGNTYGGVIDVTGQIAGRGVPSASGKIVATNLDSGELTKAGFLGSQITGPLNLNADLNTLGLSMAEMVEGLNGTGQIGGTITVLTQVEQQVGSALLDLLGGKVKQVKGLTDTLNGLFSAFAGSPNTLSGDFVVTNGVVKTENTQLENATARLLAQGTADLGGWTMDMLANVFKLPSDSPYLAVGLNGILDSPNVKLSGNAISGGAAGGLGGALQQVVPGLSGEGGGTATEPGGGLGGALQQIVPGLNQKETAPGTPAAPDAATPEAPATQTAPQSAAPAPTPAPEAAPAPETPAPEAVSPEPQPAPTEPTPEAAPEEPAAAEEAPADAAPTEPAPTEPAPAEPAPEAAPEAVPEAMPQPEPEAAPEAAPETMPLPEPEAAPQPEPEAAPQPDPEAVSPDAAAPSATEGEAEDPDFIPPAEDDAPAEAAPAPAPTPTPDAVPDAVPPADTEAPQVVPLPQ